MPRAHLKSAFFCLSTLALAACSVTADVTGYVGSTNDVYRGTSTGYVNHTGEIFMSNETGVRCVGHYTWWSSGGHGLLTCSNGKQAQVHFTRLSFSSGYGYGQTSTGEPIQFTFGLSEEESKKYITLAPAKVTEKNGSGTAFFISDSGMIVTNHHVIDGCTSLRATAASGITQPVEVVASDGSNDLALLKSPHRSPAYARFRATPPVRQGDDVVVFGFPLSGTLTESGNLTTGIVSALAGLANDSRYLQISAPIQPGNSGGPLLDSSANVIGIVTSKLNAIRMAARTGDIPQNVNFAVNALILRNFLDTAGRKYDTQPSAQTLRTVDIAERARQFSVKIECRG